MYGDLLGVILLHYGLWSGAQHNEILLFREPKCFHHSILMEGHPVGKYPPWVRRTPNVFKGEVGGFQDHSLSKVQWLQTHHWEQLPRSAHAQQNRTTAQESDRNGITGGLKENGEMVF